MVASGSSGKMEEEEGEKKQVGAVPPHHQLNFCLYAFGHLWIMGPHLVEWEVGKYGQKPTCIFIWNI